MDLKVLSDVHYAYIWDEFDKAFPKSVNFLNPNRRLREFITTLNADDILILNGDTVDYYYSLYKGKGKSNWEYVKKDLKNFKGELMINAGNHDYRGIPYNLALFGMHRFNISQKQRKKYAKHIKFAKFRFFKEFSSMWVNLKKANLAKGVTSKPKTKRINDSALLLLNTGPDLTTDVSAMLNPLNWFQAISINPASKGLADSDMRLLNKHLNNPEIKNLYLFLHSPPFLIKRSKHIMIPTTKCRYNFMFRLIKNILFLKNNYRFLQAIMKSEKNIVIVSSHLHNPLTSLLDKNTNVASKSTMKEINKHYSNPEKIKFVTTPAFGALRKGNPLGYVHITDKKIEYKLF